MADTSLIKYHYPVSTDLIADGASDMQELAGDVEASLFLATNKFTGTDDWTKYPVGQSLMNVTGDTWPYTSGIVMSYKTAPSGTVTWQTFYARSTWTENQRILSRIGYNASSKPTWSPWQVVAGPGTAEEEATGSMTVTPTANQPKAFKVTFPSNRFSKNPRVFLQYQGQQPQDVALSTYNRTPTGFTAYVYRTGSTSVTFHWHAVVMASDLPNN